MMHGNALPRGIDPTPLPPQSHALSKITTPLYRAFDWLYGSDYNPLYRSGTLAVGFLFVLLITGLYLSFFYSVSAPYESLVAIDSQVWLGRWVRTLHRYATVATVVAIFFHVLQLLAQGKCWGPRLLAWLSGVILVGMFLLSAWSGYVMMWDTHGQQVAISGAKMLAQFPLIRDVVNASFDGTSEIPPGFFFMNLFLHVGIPLGMIFLLWVHTARLSRSVWLPKRSILIGWTLALTALSILWPAPLLPKANLLQIIGRIPTDISTGWWIPLLMEFGSVPAWGAFVILGGLLCIIPWWWRPQPDQERPTSKVDVAACSGCTQCTRDCPYEAIRMVPRSDGKRLVAEVLPSNCVSCGVCAASCADYAIGPEGRTAKNQKERIEQFCAEVHKATPSLDLVLIACANNTGLNEILEEYGKTHSGVLVYPVECCGCVHSEVIEEILEVSKGCALIGCPARNCFNRDGGDLLAQRIFEKRVPFLERSIDRARLMIAPYSVGESGRLKAAVARFHHSLNPTVLVPARTNGLLRRVLMPLTSIVLLCLCAFAAQVPVGLEIDHAIVRVAGNLSSASKEECRTPSPGELAHLPLHMRTQQICEKRLLQYELRIRIDDQEVVSRRIHRKDGRVDLPIFLDTESPINPGKHLIEFELTSDRGMVTRCSRKGMIEAGTIVLAQFHREREELTCR